MQEHRSMQAGNRDTEYKNLFPEQELQGLLGELLYVFV